MTATHEVTIGTGAGTTEEVMTHAAGGGTGTSATRVAGVTIPGAVGTTAAAEVHLMAVDAIGTDTVR